MELRRFAPQFRRCYKGDPALRRIVFEMIMSGTRQKHGTLRDARACISTFPEEHADRELFHSILLASMAASLYKAAAASEAYTRTCDRPGGGLEHTYVR